MADLALMAAAIVIALCFLGIGFGLALDRAYDAKANVLGATVGGLFLGVCLFIAMTMPWAMLIWPVIGLIIGFFIGWVL